MGMMQDPSVKFATPRLASGVLFADSGDRMFLVRKTYGNGWDIPGGMSIAANLRHQLANAKSAKSWD
jgi:hypothetical protein